MRDRRGSSAIDVRLSSCGRLSSCDSHPVAMDSLQMPPLFHPKCLFVSNRSPPTWISIQHSPARSTRQYAISSVIDSRGELSTQSQCIPDRYCRSSVRNLSLPLPLLLAPSLNPTSNKNLPPSPMPLYFGYSPAPTILHPHSGDFLFTTPSVHPKNYAPHNGPAKFWHGPLCQIALATLQLHPDRLDLKVSCPLPQYPCFCYINIPAPFNTSNLRHTHSPPDITQRKPRRAVNLVGKSPTCCLTHSRF